MGTNTDTGTEQGTEILTATFRDLGGSISCNLHFHREMNGKEALEQLTNLLHCITDAADEIAKRCGITPEQVTEYMFE